MSDVHFGFTEKKQYLENQKEKKNQFSHHLVINFRILKEWTLVEHHRPFCLSSHLPRISITLKLPFDRDKVKRPFTLVQKLVPVIMEPREEAVEAVGWATEQSHVSKEYWKILEHGLRNRKAPPHRSLSP